MDPSFLVTCISKKIYETRIDEWHTAWINLRVPSLGVDIERDFLPVVSSFHKTYKANKIKSFYLSIGGQYSHTRNLEVLILARENHIEIFCLSPHNGHKMLRLDKAFMGLLKTFFEGRRGTRR